MYEEKNWSQSSHLSYTEDFEIKIEVEEYAQNPSTFSMENQANISEPQIPTVRERSMNSVF